MKTTNRVMTVLTLLMAYLVVGCSPNKTTRSTYESGSVRSDVVGQNQQSWPTCGNQSSSSVGTIYDSNGDIDFENRVKLFLSAAVNPNDVGSISPMPNGSTGVRFNGAVKLDAQGNVQLSSSKISIKIYDSYVVFGGAQYAAIPIDISVASEGKFNPSTGTGYVVFKDKYGEVRFDGQIDAQYFKGQVSYKNYATVIANSQPASGTLGQFYIARCGMIQ